MKKKQGRAKIIIKNLLAQAGSSPRQWNPMKIEQRIGRIHRIGQEKEVQIFNFCAAGSIEDYILDILDRKINMFEMVIGEIDMILGMIREQFKFHRSKIIVTGTGEIKTRYILLTSRFLAQSDEQKQGFLDFSMNNTQGPWL